MPSNNMQFTGHWQEARGYMIALSLLVMSVYLPVIMFPYLLLDDNWLVRRSPGTPDMVYIATTQGRPVFALMIRLMREFTGNSDSPQNIMTVIQIVRGLAIVGLAGFGAAFFGWLRMWGASKRVAFLTAALAVTLPSLEMYVLGGPWLTVALVGSIVSVYFVYYAVLSKRLTQAIYWGGGAVVVQGLCWATYQGTGPVIASLVLVAFIWSTPEDWNINFRWKPEWKTAWHALTVRAKFVVLGAFIFVLSLGIYLALWNIEYYFVVGSESRYSPSSVNILNISVLSHFFTARLVQMMNLWDVTFVKGWFFWGSLSGFVLAIGKDFFKYSIKFSLIKWVLVVFGLILADLPALSGNSSSGVPAPIYSYMTSGALGILVASILGYGLIPFISLDKYKGKYARDIAVFALIAVMLFFSMRLVLTHFAVPLWLEYRYVRSQIEHFSNTQGNIEGVRTFVRKPPLLATGLQEFSWSNLQASFYLHWMIRNTLDELGLYSRIRIDVVTQTGEILTSPDYEKEPDPDKVITIDTRMLRLR